MRGKQFELYDLVDDPHEEHNLAAFQPDVVQTMAKTLRRIRRENKERRAQNIEALDEGMDQLSEEEQKKVMQQLRALGYVK